MHIINHPTYLEHIQKTNSKNYIRGKFTRNAFGTLHRSGIFVADGMHHQTQRRAALKAFSKRNFEDHIVGSVHHWTEVLLKLLANLAKENRVFDFQDLMGRMMFVLFLRVAFHEDGEMCGGILSEHTACLDTKPEFVRAFDDALMCFDRRRRDPMWRWTEWWNGEGTVTARAVNMFYERIDALIEKRIEMVKNGYKADENKGVDLLALFMRDTTDKYTLGGQLFSFLSAGRDTTTYNTSWYMMEIHHTKNAHLDALKKIRDEVDELGFHSTLLGYSDAPVGQPL